jgi:hypothetical protein
MAERRFATFLASLAGVALVFLPWLAPAKVSGGDVTGARIGIGWLTAAGFLGCALAALLTRGRRQSDLGRKLVLASAALALLGVGIAAALRRALWTTAAMVDYPAFFPHPAFGPAGAESRATTWEPPPTHLDFGGYCARLCALCVLAMARASTGW